MDYHCSPDFSEDRDVTIDAVKLFHRFRQAADLERVEHLREAEIKRHLRLCEFAIMHAAAAGIYWAELPRHGILDVDLAVSRHLKLTGFKVEFRREVRDEEVPTAHDRTKHVCVPIVRERWFAEWFFADAANPATSTEWQRREALEDEARKKNPPARQSTGLGAELKAGGAIWAAELDGQWVVEVQRLHGRSFLCVFDLAGGRLRHIEETGVAYGATFGPDAGDLAEWQQRAEQIVDRWRKPPSGEDPPGATP